MACAWAVFILGIAWTLEVRPEIPEATEKLDEVEAC
jgi:hypothetical protein